MSGYNGDLKVYPATEMLPIDMAEALRAVSNFNGIIQGCRLSIPTGTTKLVMTPGWVLIGGRVGSFSAQEGETTCEIELPTVSSNGTERFVCIVCDLTNYSQPLYIDILDEAGYNSKNTTGDFNQTNGSIALKIGKVTINTSGGATALDVATGRYPDYKIKTGKDYTDTIDTKVDDKWDVTNAWIQYFKKAKHRSAFFRRTGDCIITADGLTIPANTTSTFKFRPEYGSQVVIKPASGTPTLPSNKPYVYINPDGTFVSTSPNQSAGPSPSTTKTYYNDRNGNQMSIVSSLYEGQKNCGVVGMKITNAGSGGSQGDKCLPQSWYFGTEGQYDTEYLYVKIRNTSSAAAKIRLDVTCLFVQNIDYPS